MNKKILVPLLAIFVLMLSITPVYAQTPKHEELSVLGYTKIRLYPKFEGPESFSSSETTYIIHGWMIGEDGLQSSWQAMTLIQKIEYLITARFELYVNKDRVRLNPYIWYDSNPDSETFGEMYVVFWKVFEPGTFSVGRTKFRAIWTIQINGKSYTYQNVFKIDITE